MSADRVTECQVTNVGFETATAVKVATEPKEIIELDDLSVAQVIVADVVEIAVAEIADVITGGPERVEKAKFPEVAVPPAPDELTA